MYMLKHYSSNGNVVQLRDLLAKHFSFLTGGVNFRLSLVTYFNI